jgi:hypothetical protein
MAYPVIDQPMYEPLRDLGADYFLPRADLIPSNTVTLLETNQRFIEAYLAGVNHEFARELLWREYPTDQRGTPFRQFWDARCALNVDGLPESEFREQCATSLRCTDGFPESPLGGARQPAKDRRARPARARRGCSSATRPRSSTPTARSGRPAGRHPGQHQGAPARDR